MARDLVVASHGGTGVGDGCREQRPGRRRVGRIRAARETSIDEVRLHDVRMAVANAVVQRSADVEQCRIGHQERAV